jgi:hypothetical protein
MDSCPSPLGCEFEKTIANLNTFTMKTKDKMLILFLSINLLGFAQKSAPVEGYFDGGINCRHAASVSCGGDKGLSSHTYLYLDEEGNLLWDIYYKHFNNNDLEVLLGEPFSKDKSVYFYIVEESFVLDEILRIKLKLHKEIGRIPKDVYLAIVEGDIIHIQMPLVEINPENNTNNQKE